VGLFGKRKVKMDQNELYETPAGMKDSGERLEKKEQLRAKVQALVSYYEEEKRRNEELSMELERLKAEQQHMQGMPLAGPAPGMGLPPMAPPPSPPGMGPMGAAPGGIPFSQRPPQAFPGMPGGMPGPESPPAPQGPQAPQSLGGYTLQNFGAPPQPGFGMGPQGFPPPRPPQPPQPQQNPYGAPPPPWQPPQQPFAAPFGQPAGFPQPGLAPGAQQQPFGAPPMPGYPPQAPYQQNDGLPESVGLVLQTITQVRARLHQSESIRGYGYPQQPMYVDYDTVALLDKLYDQLGDLTRELMLRQGR